MIERLFVIFMSKNIKRLNGNINKPYKKRRYLAKSYSSYSDMEVEADLSKYSKN